jgi:hypothetical protein
VSRANGPGYCARRAPAGATGFAGAQPMRKKKLLAIMGVLFGSPICAEYLMNVDAQNR